MFKKRGIEKSYSGWFARNKMAIAVATLMGTIIGAGILGIPYVIAKTGLLYGLIIILLLGAAYLFINFFVGEIVLRTRETHQLTGYAEKYLGRWAKHIFGGAMFFGIYGALTAYLIGEGETIFTLLKFGSPLFYSLLFGIVGFFIVSRGIKATGRVELFLISALAVVVILIGIFSYDQITWKNVSYHNFTYFLFPYGVVLFAYFGFASIPEVKEELGKETKKLKEVLLIGSVIPILLYIVFGFIVVGIVGIDNFEMLLPNERIATIALSIYSLPALGLLANILAVLTMFTSFLALSMVMLDVYEKDYGFSSRLALALTFLVPIIIVLLNFTSFISLLGVVGTFTGGIEGILVVLMFWKAKQIGNRKPEYSLGQCKVVGTLLILMFIFGIVYFIAKALF